MSFIVILFCECTEFDLTCFVTFVINKKFWIELVKKFFSNLYILGLCSSHLKINLIIYFSGLLFFEFMFNLCSHFSNLNSCYFLVFNSFSFFLFISLIVINLRWQFSNVNKKNYYYFSCHVSFKCANKAYRLPHKHFPLMT